LHKYDHIRLNGPEIHPIRRVPVPEFKLRHLDNGIPIYFINDGSQELTKLDIVFEGGRHAETLKTSSRAFSVMLKEGTSSYNSEELSSFFDYYGASYTTRSSLDFTTVTLFSLTKYFPLLIERLSEMILQPAFPQKELDKFRETSIQKLKLDKSKNEVVAYRMLTEQIFGKEAVYGYNSSKETYDAIDRQVIQDYYHKALQEQPCKIFLCGKYDENVLEYINKFLGQWDYKGKSETQYKSSIFRPKKLSFESTNEHQVAVRLGQLFGNRKHEDYGKLMFLSNLFGGFFGSRLMKNIREDKAYTYNIFSDLDCMLHDGYFYIASEMAPEYVNPAIEEIHKEMNLLRTVTVSKEELEMNKNYILGNLLTAVDGPFQAIRLVKSAVLNKRTREDVQNTIDTFINITPEEIQETAKKYLNPEDYTQVLVGV